ncbi:MAG TPA: YdcF family protein [Pyrinomonadaceae bacterium]
MKLAFLLLLPALWIPFAYALAVNLEAKKTLARADAILVLSGSSEYAERADEAAALYKADVSRKIFLTNDGLQSGWNQNEQRNPFFVELARQRLIGEGVGEESIEVLAPAVDGTIDEANLFAQKASERNLRSVVLVTSAYHSRRALRTFERVFAANNLPVEIGVACPAEELRAVSPVVWWLSFQGWKTVALEYLKIAYYWWYF